MSMRVPKKSVSSQAASPASSSTFRMAMTVAGTIAGVVAVVGTFSFSACLPLDGRPCNSGADCLAGWRCVEATCVEESTLDACTGTSDCSGDRICEDEVCVPAEPEVADGGVDGGTIGVDAGGVDAGDVDAGDGVDGGPGPEPVPEDGGVVRTRVVSLLNVSEDSIDVSNAFGAVTIGGSQSSQDVVVSATMLLSAVAAARVDEIEIDLSDVGVGIDVEVSMPQEAAFADAVVNLAITIPLGFEVGVFPGSSAPAAISNASGGIDVINGGGLTGTSLAGEIVVVVESGTVTIDATLDQNIDITTSNGNIVLSLPADSAFQLDATSQLSLVPSLVGFNLTGSASFGVAAGIVGNIVSANDHDVILRAPNGSITIIAAP